MKKLHQPTDEMFSSLDGFQSGSDLMIEAGAGTGKTSTLLLLALSRRRSRGKYIVYNRAMRDEATEIFPKPVRCSTAHMLAWGPVGQFYEHRLDKRMPSREVARILGIHESFFLRSKIDKDKFLEIKPKVAARIVTSALTRFSHSAEEELQPWMIQPPDGCDTVEAHKDLCERLLPIARRAWDDVNMKNGRLPFQQDYYLKIWALEKPELKGCDYILLDEAQDADPVIAQIFERQTQVQRVLVGDRYQAIYGWRGAVDAMAKFEQRGVAVRRLTQSFRFGDAIAAEANKLLALMDSSFRLRGFSEIHSAIATVDHADAVLCRSNKGTIAEMMYELNLGRKVALVGGTNDLKKLAYAAIDLKDGKGTTYPDLMAFTTWDELREYAELDEAGKDLKVFVALIDEHGPQLLLKLCDQMVDERDADVVISTAHRSKGREWSNVRIGDDFYPPPKDREASEAELMLAYVAVTRAKYRLERGSLEWVDEYIKRLEQ